MRIHAFIIDPQNDFVVGDEKLRLKGSGDTVSTGNAGTLVVPGAQDDMTRLATMLHRLGGKIADITVTLDSHQEIGIERPKWWKRVGDGAEPAPFTIMGIHPDGRRIVKFTADVTGLHPTDEEYTTYMPSFLHKGGPTGKGTFGYLEALAIKGRYPHVVWPVHCVIGEWGHNIVPELQRALRTWALTQFATVDRVTKGSNPWTEHFSGVQAEVPDPSDPSTQVNTRLIQTLEKADIIVVAGEALSHCIAHTVRDVATCFSDPKYVEKIVLLKDACSNVPGFDSSGTDFIRDMTAKGMKISTTTEFLA